MTFRTRLHITSLLTVIVPMIVLALLIRHEMTDRLTAQYERRVETLVAVIEEDLTKESEGIALSLSILRDAVLNDNRFRRAAVDRVPEERRYLLDYAGDAMQLTGLSMLQIQDESGRIISSGHFRNEYDRMEPLLPRLLASTAEGTALVQARTPDGPFLALARIDSVQMGSRQFMIVAGLKVERRFLSRLARGDGLCVALVYPGGRLISSDDVSYGGDVSSMEDVTAVEDVASGGNRSGVKETWFESDDPAFGSAIVRDLSVPFIDPERGEPDVARFRVAHELTELHTLRRSIDRWFLIAVAAAGCLAVIVVSWLASRISRPLVALADKTSRIDLERLDIDFETQRNDEIGVLSRLLGAMTERLRAGALMIRDAEHRATLGELARQVNHDIKNGLTPIRNVFRHLAQLASSRPGELPKVFEERRHTLDSSISYLESLASNYARLSSRGERRPCNVNEIISRVVANLQGFGHVSLETHLNDGAVVLGDPVSLRRVLENLLDNAIESLDSQPGTITVSTSCGSADCGRPQVRIAVTDTGRGMSEEQMARVFDDFYTTKESGTGLGLSIVRRLVMDLDGTIHVESEEGKGSRFLINLPGVGAA